MPKPLPIAWAGIPAADEVKPMLLIVPAPSEGQVELVLLSRELVGVWTHWLHGRTQPCTAPHGCACEGFEISRRWKGYLGAYLLPAGQIVLAEITWIAANKARLGSIERHPGDLRGLTARMRRHRRASGGGCVFEILDRDRYPDARLPGEPDVRAELQRIWNSKGG